MRKLVFLASEVVGIAALAGTLVLAGLAVIPSRASAALSPGQLGRAGNYSVLGGTGVVNTLNTVLNADLGVSPGNSIRVRSPRHRSRAIRTPVTLGRASPIRLGPCI